jgi:hypothetical protein
MFRAWYGRTVLYSIRQASTAGLLAVEGTVGVERAVPLRPPADRSG